MSAFTEKAAFVVDDVLPPWRVRGAEVFAEGGKEIMDGFSEELIRVFPRRIVGWGLDSGDFRANSRSVG